MKHNWNREEIPKLSVMNRESSIWWPSSSCNKPNGSFYFFFSRLGNPTGVKLLPTTSLPWSSTLPTCIMWWLTKAWRRRFTSSFRFYSKPSTKTPPARFRLTSLSCSSSAWGWRSATRKFHSWPSTETTMECSRLKNSWSSAANSSWPRIPNASRETSGVRWFRTTEL